MLLLDTSICVEVLRVRGLPQVVSRFHALRPGDAATCSVVRFEFMRGVRASRARATNAAAVEALLATLPSLPMDDRAADEASDIAAHLAALGTPIGPYDLLIAAIARANGTALVTANAAEFARVPGLRVEDWRAVVAPPT
jgi:tRNA(fMet)-specific endonuclease VapC